MTSQHSGQCDASAASGVSPSTQTATLDRRAIALMACLALVAVVVNLDRFVAGMSGPLRAHDLADNTITRLAACGEFWRSSLSSAWDASRVRGWPIVSGDYSPQLLMCMVSGAVQPPLILPILHTVLLAVMAVGAFLFVRFFLEWREDVAVAGAVLHVVLYFFFHEHPMVTSAILLPPLVGYLSVPACGVGSRAIQVAGAALVMMLSNPTSTLFAMPLGHLALILVIPRGKRGRHLVAFTCLWFAYSLYYAPTLVAQLREFASSSRSVYRSNPVGIPYVENLKGLLLNPAVISPAAVFLILVGRRTWLRTLLSIMLVVGGIALAAANQALVGSDLAKQAPILLTISTMYYRMYYFVPVGLLLWVAWLWQDEERPSARVLLRRGLGLAAFCVLIAFPLAHTSWPSVTVFVSYWRYAVVLGLSMGFGLTWWTRRVWTTVVVAGAVVLSARYEYTKTWEVPYQGNVFLEEPNFGQPKSLSRTATVMSTCDGVDLFPAQARAAGLETLDGISNLYDRGFVERWRYFIADNPALCTARYATWPTRAEVTVGDLQYASDRILFWFWINNVEFVRAPKPLDYPELQLIDERVFTYDKVQHVTRYLYRVRNPASRVFTLPVSVASRAASPDLSIEEATLSDLIAHGGLSNVDAQAADNSHLRFTGTFEPGRTVVANMNYHRGWRLRIDGRPSRVPIEPGPFGMIAFQPPPGSHAYELEFHSSATVFIPLCMLASIGLLWVSSDPRVTKRLESVGSKRVRADEAGPKSSERRVQWRTAGMLIASVGLLAGIVWWKSPVHSATPWLDGPWSHRLAVRTEGAGQTAPLPNFPLRVEISRRQADFWKAVQASGADIRLTDSGGQRLLPFEVEEFDRARERFIAWVRLPQLPTGPGTVAYLYYGNPNAASAVNQEPVWDDQYEVVWHMNPRRTAVDGAIADSTGRGRSAVLHNITVNGTDDGRGIPFDGVSGWAEIPHWPGLASTNGDWTIELSMKPAPKAKRNFELLEHGSAGIFNLYLHSSAYLVLERKNGDQLSEVGFSNEHLEDDRWTAVTLSRARRHLRIAVDGTAHRGYPVPTFFPDSAVDAPLKVGLGAYGRFEGRLAEVRISRGVARSADWTLASFRCFDPSFVTFGMSERSQQAESP
jgi:hypothetical protein